MMGVTDNLQRGIIRGFCGSWGSGLGYLIIEDDFGMTQHVPCENAQTVRCLEGAFGDVIGNAHDVKTNGGHIGKEIFYSTDFMGILEGFTPVEDAPPELLDMFYDQEEN